MAKKSNVREIDFEVLEFWDAVRGLLSDAGRYAHSYKLRENVSDSATKFKVEHVFARYYDSDMRKLNDDIHFRRRQCSKAITWINELCNRLKMRDVSDRDALIDLLLDGDRRDGWKKLIKKYEKNNQVVSLQRVELEYRENLAKKAP